jgi:putative ABC transport system ATP-binding protein
MLIAHSLSKTYTGGETPVPALRGVSFSISAGECVALVGPSGCGKSTLLSILGLLDSPSSGTYTINGGPVQELDFAKRARIRNREIGFIFQSFNLIPVLDVFENIEFPLLMGNGRIPRAQRREWVDFLVAEVGLEQWRDHKPNELSGGQRQRVAIARALVAKPKIVLADEPTANLDSTTGEQIISLMKKINREMDTTFIFSTHDPHIVGIADHVIRLIDGQVVENVRVEPAAEAR